MESVYRDYLTDLAPSASGIFPVLREVGHREPDQLARWFADANAHAVIILFGDARVGFAMVSHRLRDAGAAGAGTDMGGGAPEFSMAEFFIARGWRRRGIGAQAARLILDRFTGQWLITQHLRNTTAVEFWRRVVAAYTGGKYQERMLNGEVHQRFESGSRRLR